MTLPFIFGLILYTLVYLLWYIYFASIVDYMRPAMWFFVQLAKGVTDFGHLRILENMLSEATKLRALCFLKLFLLVLMVGSENSRGHV